MPTTYALKYVYELAHPQERGIELRKFCRRGVGLLAVRRRDGLAVPQRLSAFHQLFTQNIDLASQLHVLFLVIVDYLRTRQRYERAARVFELRTSEIHVQLAQQQQSTRKAVVPR